MVAASTKVRYGFCVLKKIVVGGNKTMLLIANNPVICFIEFFQLKTEISYSCISDKSSLSDTSPTHGFAPGVEYCP